MIFFSVFFYKFELILRKRRILSTIKKTLHQTKKKSEFEFVKYFCFFSEDIVRSNIYFFDF